MKISNLYIGDIRKITKVEKVESNKTYNSKRVRKTVLLKHDGSKYAKDLLYGGKYRVGNYKANRVGKKYATDLNQYYLLRDILESGYTRKHISKFRIKKIMKKKIKEM